MNLRLSRRPAHCRCAPRSWAFLRRPGWRPATVVAAFVAAVLNLAGTGGPNDGFVAQLLPPAVAPPAAAPEDPGSGDRLTPFAEREGVKLVPPSPRYLVIGFHEAAGYGTLLLTPRGQLQANDHPGVVAPPDEAGRPYRILGPRGRGTRPTSAVDIAMRDGDPVHAVVSGTVVAAGAYPLYGTVHDEMVAITADSNSAIHVKMLHLRGVRVRVGQRVAAGETVVADSARQLPLGSQIDRFSGGPHPHVHIELVRR